MGSSWEERWTWTSKSMSMFTEHERYSRDSTNWSRDSFRLTFLHVGLHSLYHYTSKQTSPHWATVFLEQPSRLPEQQEPAYLDHWLGPAATFLAFFGRSPRSWSFFCNNPVDFFWYPFKPPYSAEAVVIWETHRIADLFEWLIVKASNNGKLGYNTCFLEKNHRLEIDDLALSSILSLWTQSCLPWNSNGNTVEPF